MSDDWQRPPHIHFKVSKRGYAELITQMYFAGQPLNQQDRLLQHHSVEEQSAMIATPLASFDHQIDVKESDPTVYHYQIILKNILG